MLAVINSSLFWGALICCLIWGGAFFLASRHHKKEMKRLNDKHPYKARRERLNPEVERLLELDEIEEKIS
jgi:hypothetical protein